MRFNCCHWDKKVTSITWTKFKAFLQKKFGKFKSFINNIWKKLKKDSQYQLEEVYDWVFQRKYLQSILIEFDPTAIPTKLIIVRYFEEGLKLSIKAKTDKNATHLDYYEKLVAKAVRAKAKSGQQPNSYLQKTDQQVFQDRRPAYTTTHKVQTQGAMKDYDGDKSTAKAFVPNSSQDSEPFDKAKKDKKKKKYKDTWDSINPVTGVNTAEVCKKNRKKKDISEIIYYNYNIKRYYTTKYPKFRKSRN